MRQRIRGIFHWTYSGVLIPVFIGLGGLMLSIGASLAETEKWLFVAAYLFFVLALLWTLGYWLTSEALRKRNPKYWNRNRRKQTNLRRATVVYQSWLWGGVLACLAGFAASAVFTNFVWQKKEWSELRGFLAPGDDPDPKGLCRPEGRELAIRVGSNYIKTDQFPLSVIKAGDDSVLTMDRLETGQIAILMDIRSEDQKIIARLDRNGFIVSQDNKLTWSRTKSSLYIVDAYGNEVLNAKYRNKHFFDIKARIRVHSRVYDFTKLGVSDNCVYNFRLGSDGAVIRLP
jgi:hypothetical protein